MNRSLSLLILLLVSAGAAAAWYFWPFGNGAYLRFPGIVEIQEVRLGSKIGGRVGQVVVAEGQRVEPGQPLVMLLVPELEATRDQLRAHVQAAEAELERAVHGPRLEEKRAAQAAADAAKARYDKLVAGWREEEKRLAQSELEAAQAELKRADEDLSRIRDLYRMRAVARAEYDAARGARDQAAGRFNAAKAKHDMYLLGSRAEDKAEAKAQWQQAQAKADELYAGSRPEDIALARAKLAEAKAKLAEVEISIAEAVIRTPEAPQFRQAVVEVVAVRPGDLVAPNQPVVRVLCTDDLWVKIFVPETKLGLVTLNQRVQITIDSYPGKVFEGEIVQRASISEFTPRNVQSVDERRHQVFGVKIRVDDPQGVFSAGMAAEVTIPRPPPP